MMMELFANTAPGEAPVSVIDFPDKEGGGPLWCERCKAYANPGYNFSSGGIVGGSEECEMASLE